LTIDGGAVRNGPRRRQGQGIIVFAGGGTLEVDATKKLAAPISGFGVPDHIDRK
jgi:hypothetical protein